MTVCGELDAAAAPRLHDALVNVVDHDRGRDLVTEIKGDTFIDSSGFFVLIHVTKLVHASSRGRTLRRKPGGLRGPRRLPLTSTLVMQAYLKDSRHDLADLVAWSSSRARPVTIRLVKGAYWETETVQAQAEDWPVPVFDFPGFAGASGRPPGQRGVSGPWR